MDSIVVGHSILVIMVLTRNKVGTDSTEFISKNRGSERIDLFGVRMELLHIESGKEARGEDVIYLIEFETSKFLNFVSQRLPAVHGVVGNEKYFLPGIHDMFQEFECVLDCVIALPLKGLGSAKHIYQDSITIEEYSFVFADNVVHLCEGSFGFHFIRF